MSDASTRQLIDMYMEEATPPMFLSGFFQSPPRNFHTTETVEIDILRDDEEVAIVVQDLSAGARENKSSVFTNKEFVPPIYDETGTITSYSMMRRQPGVDPFQSPDYLANATADAFRIFRKLENKIRRAIELQAAQVLRTGKLTLLDQNGVSLYALDFKPKTTHFPTVTTAWGSAGYAPLSDIEALAAVVRRDGKGSPNQLIFGTRAFDDFIANTDVKNRLDRLGVGIGQLAPESRGKGATFQGWVWIGNYRFEMWTYDGYYKDPQTGVLTSYIGDDEMIMLSAGGRLDLTYGAIPMIRRPEDRALSFLPPRLASAQAGLDLTTNSWFTDDGKHLKVSAGTRPLTIPTAIDTFACLKTR